MPSRSVLDTATPPDTTGKSPDPGSLPTGLTVAPTPPGISPLSGLPIAELPAVSRGTKPIGPRTRAAGAVRPAVAPTEPGATASVGRPTDPAARTAHPGTNPRVGMAPATTVVPTPPPPAQPEPTPPKSTNDLGQMWVNGHYSWVNGQWRWVNGTWQRPPEENAQWVPGSYDELNKRWTEGHWDVSPRPATPVSSGSEP